MRSQALRTGYTTGACAAAAAKAATLALLRHEAVGQVEITLPGGNAAVFPVNTCAFDTNTASCSVVKDAGDDPDVTDGIEIYAAVQWTTRPGVTIVGGKGVGVLTKPGLEVATGEPAINPVPRRMIEQAVREGARARLEGAGIAVTISAPEGETLAKRTLNARLGITGGISILGTTGIVIPYSKDAYTACIRQSVAVAAACGCRETVLTTGRRSEKFAQQVLHLPEECFIQAGDYIGYALEQCAGAGMERVTVWGMVGKMSKLAAGHLYTNVSDSVVSIDLLAGLAAECGLADTALGALREAVTANHFRKMLPPDYSPAFHDRLCLVAAEKCAAPVVRKVSVRCVVTDPDGSVLGSGHVQG